MSQLLNISSDLLVILGPTATGKTQLAVQLADKLNGEIISADSRQIYKRMDIGTGKDLDDYELDNKIIPYHLINIADPTENYSVASFQKDFQRVFTGISKYNKLPILCGGTGFYIKAVLMDFQLSTAEPNKKLRQKLEKSSLQQLIQTLESISPGISKVKPIDTKRRVIRAIEVETENMGTKTQNAKFQIRQYAINNSLVIGIDYTREVIRERITKRLHKRLKNGMIEEVESLLMLGVTHERLERFGLEYRFISRYLKKLTTKDEMTTQLNTAIHRFAKKQMTFFRNMEKNGININWIPEGNFESALKVIIE